jgi:hypothetical protein
MSLQQYQRRIAGQQQQQINIAPAPAPPEPPQQPPLDPPVE